MSKTFDALYGGILDDVLTKDVAPTIPKENELARIVAVLKSRAEGYFNRAQRFNEQGENADYTAAMGTCKELAYVAKMLETGKLIELEAAGK
jgi:hypothetical protein